MRTLRSNLRYFSMRLEYKWQNSKSLVDSVQPISVLDSRCLMSMLPSNVATETMKTIEQCDLSIDYMVVTPLTARFFIESENLETELNVGIKLDMLLTSDQAVALTLAAE